VRVDVIAAMARCLLLRMGRLLLHRSPQSAPMMPHPYSRQTSLVCDVGRICPLRNPLLLREPRHHGNCFPDDLVRLGWASRVAVTDDLFFIHDPDLRAVN
jgi:hypothetical protein